MLRNAFNSAYVSSGTSSGGKRPPKPENVILAINAIRTPWFIQTPIVEAFRRHYGQDARRVGFREIWVVGPSATLTERLDIDSTA